MWREKSSVSRLEAEVLSEFAAFQADDNPRLDFLTMQVRLLGVTAYHGARSKSVGANSVSARCGECSFILSKDSPFSFLDIQDLFKLLLSVVPPTFHPELNGRLFALTRILAPTRPRGSKVEDWRFYRGFHLRLVSLHF